MEQQDQEMSMITSAVETVPATPRGSKGESGAEKPARGVRRPRANGGEEAGTFTRYFLAKREGNGSTPTLDREVESEGEALIEALRAGVTYYAIQEFRVIPDFSGRRPQLEKEPVRAGK